MLAVVKEGRERWVFAGAVTALVMLLVVLVLAAARIPHDTPRSHAGVLGPAVKIARPDETDLLLKEEAELRDLRPLFLPTARNAALPEPRLGPGRSILDRESLRAAAAGPEVQLGSGLPPVATIGGMTAAEARPLAAFGPDANAAGLIGFGRQDVPLVRFDPRGAFLEIIRLGDGRRVRAEPLELAAKPPGEREWSPLELLAVVDRAGLAFPLVVTEGSRVEEVDLHFKTYLANVLRLGEGLAPGTYRIIVAP